jgi:hypothetical protein
MIMNTIADAINGDVGLKTDRSIAINPNALLKRAPHYDQNRNAYVSSSTMKFSPDALVSAGITEKGVVICNFMFGSDLREPKAHRVQIYPPGQHGNQRALTM